MSVLLSENSGFAVSPLGLIRSLSKVWSVEFLPASSVHFTVPSLSPHIPACAGDTNNARPIRSCLNIAEPPFRSEPCSNPTDELSDCQAASREDVQDGLLICQVVTARFVLYDRMKVFMREVLRVCGTFTDGAGRKCFETGKQLVTTVQKWQRQSVKVRRCVHSTRLCFAR